MKYGTSDWQSSTPARLLLNAVKKPGKQLMVDPGRSGRPLVLDGPAAVAENPRTPPETLRRLAEDPDQSVQKAARGRIE